MVFDIFKKAGVFIRGKMVTPSIPAKNSATHDFDDNQNPHEHTYDKSGKLVHVDEVQNMEYFEVENERKPDSGAGH